MNPNMADNRLSQGSNKETTIMTAITTPEEITTTTHVQVTHPLMEEDRTEITNSKETISGLIDKSSKNALYNAITVVLVKDMIGQNVEDFTDPKARQDHLRSR